MSRHAWRRGLTLGMALMTAPWVACADGPPRDESKSQSPHREAPNVTLTIDDLARLARRLGDDWPRLDPAIRTTRLVELERMLDGLPASAAAPVDLQTTHRKSARPIPPTAKTADAKQGEVPARPYDHAAISRETYGHTLIPESKPASTFHKSLDGVRKALRAVDPGATPAAAEAALNEFRVRLDGLRAATPPPVAPPAVREAKGKGPGGD